MQLWTLVTVVTAALGLRKECPDHTSQCPDSATCCQLLNKSFGCCPLKNAVCCDDQIHCCPENTKCDADLCIQSTHKNTTGMIYSVRSQNVCPGGKYVCPGASTCCESVHPGLYSCCPLDSAVCCKDKTHCCPQNTACDLSAGRCVGKGFLLDMYDSQKKLPVPTKQKLKKMALLMKQNISSVVCPGGEFQCPNGYTCCKLPTGDWGCCPFPNAFCCSDHLHCCPENMKCDVTSQSCVQGTQNVSAVLNIPAIKFGSDMITCPDETQCSDYMTCCDIGKGHFGCCFYPNAVCCSDGSHCCPENHTCDLEMKICVPKRN